MLSYNIHKGFSAANRRFTLPQIRHALHSLQPDIVCLQEVQGAPARRRRTPAAWPASSQVSYLAAGSFAFAAYGANAHRGRGHHGNAILSRYPIVSETNVDLSLHRWERRGLLHTVIDLPGARTRLHVASTHLNLRMRDRREQMLIIARYLQEEIPGDEPLVLAGDFNDWRHDASTCLPDDLQEVFMALHGRSARTFPGWLPVLRLDRIYTRHVKPVRAHCLSNQPWSKLSDHGLLSARLAVAGAA